MSTNSKLWKRREAAIPRGLSSMHTLSCGVRGNVVRFLPPLTISDELANEGLDILRESLLELQAER